MEFKPFIQFAAGTYNCGAYGAGAYDEGSCTTSTGGGTTDSDSGGTSSGGLADTGMNMILLLVIGIILLTGSVWYFARNILKARTQK